MSDGLEVRSMVFPIYNNFTGILKVIFGQYKQQ